MPVYLVRWPELRASLIQAPDEAALISYLDEIDDPSQCRWTEYDGPLWIDLTIPAEIRPRDPTIEAPKSLEECEVTGAETLAARIENGEPLLDVALGPMDTDASVALQENVMAWAFPDLGRVFLEVGPEKPTDVAIVQRALESEVESLLAYNRDPEAYCTKIEAERDAGIEDEESTEIVVVGEFIVDGTEYHAVLPQEAGTEVNIERVLAKRHRAGEVIEVRTEFVGTARWDATSRTVVPTEETPGAALALLGSAQEALRVELTRGAN